MWLLSLAFSWLGISLIGLALAAGAVFAFLRGWTHVAIGLAIIAGAHVYSGSIWQASKAECEATTAREVAQIEKLWADDVATIRADHKAEVDQLEAGKAEADAALVALEASQAAKPVEGRCILSEDDARAINAR